MVKTAVNIDLVKTIDDSVDVPDYSEESDEEEEVNSLCMLSSYPVLS